MWVRFGKIGGYGFSGVIVPGLDLQVVIDLSDAPSVSDRCAGIVL